MASEEHLRLFGDALPEIVWTALPGGYVDYMNKKWFAYTGFTEHETYNNLRTAVHPDDQEKYHQTWQESLNTGKPYEIEYRFQRGSDGMYRWHLGRALPLRDSNGTIIKWLGTCVDIHAQKEAEEQIRRLNEGLEFTVLDRTKDLRKEIRQRQRAEMRYRAHLQLLRRIIDMLPMAAVAADGRGAILYANQHFHDFFSLPENSVLHEENQTLEVVHALRRRFPSRDQEKILRTLLASDKAARQEIAADEGRTFQQIGRAHV